MTNPLGLELAGKSDTGLVRPHNEDAITFNPARGFVILADGMGGYNAGEVASSMATRVVRDFLEQGLDKLQSLSGDARFQHTLHHLVVDAIQHANIAILDAAGAEAQYEGMGTTIVVAVFHQDKVTLAHVGDSRTYRWRKGELEQITCDHSLLQEQIDAGLITPDVARYSYSKNLVTRAVGIGRKMEVEIHDHVVQAGDLFLLCSDGLSDMLPEEEICGMLSREHGDLESVCEALVKKANNNGGIDNISVVLAKILSTRGRTKGILGRMFNWIS